MCLLSFSCIDLCGFFFQVAEESKKLALVNTQLNKLTQNVSKSAEMEKKVQDLEQKLQLAYSNSDEQASKEKKKMLWNILSYPDQ